MRCKQIGDWIKVNLLYAWKKKYAKDGTSDFAGKGQLTEMSALPKQLREITILMLKVGLVNCYRFKTRKEAKRVIFSVLICVAILKEFIQHCAIEPGSL